MPTFLFDLEIHMANKALMDLHAQGIEVMKLQNKTGLSLGLSCRSFQRRWARNKH